MNIDDLNKKLKQLDIEDFIWVIYIGIIFFSWYSNYLERNYFINNDLNSKKKYITINKTIFSILLIVYIFFLKGAYEDLKNLKQSDSKNKIKLTYLAFAASLLFTIGGAIFLYITFNDDELNIEVAFN